MKEFEKWLSWVVGIEGKEWPAFPRFGTVDEDDAARQGWKAALDWFSDELTNCADFTDVHNTIIRELKKDE